MKKSPVAFLVLLIWVPFASAQTTTTGVIEGIVVDSNHAVVPDVKVIVTSPNLIRTQSATTDNEGRYRILNPFTPASCPTRSTNGTC